jgi:hypothetical protein
MSGRKTAAVTPTAYKLSTSSRAMASRIILSGRKPSSWGETPSARQESGRSTRNASGREFGTCQWAPKR